ncbi:hypothetical protein, partial [Thermomonas sp.]|uniref:hypothetical protein n=1 Tax=Thermomonas sp. TaxID=1971895 RepID=UPI0035B1A43E
MTPVDRLAPLPAWREAGWLQPLDLPFARWLHTLDPAAPARPTPPPACSCCCRRCTPARRRCAWHWRRP